MISIPGIADNRVLPTPLSHKHFMRHLLPILPRPSRYLGIEEGSAYKDRAKVTLHIALAFPDLYEVAMSYLGQKILYDIINANPDWYAERVFTPCRDASKILKEHKVPLATLESDTPLAKLDFIGFSITHELCYTNVLLMLDLAGIPFRASERSSKHPLIVAGGGCTVACEPLAPFFDMMILGEGEESTPELLRLVEKAKLENWSRDMLFLQAIQIPGIYVPSLQNQETPHAIAPARRVIANLDNAAYPKTQPVPFGAVHNRLALEIARGCTRGCRFCQAGMIYRPARERSVDNLVALTEHCLSATGYDDLSFLSLSTGDFSALKTLFLQTADRCAGEQVSVSLPSLRVGSIDDEIMNRMAGIRRTGATIAPEAGSQRLRDVINKGVNEEAILTHARKLFEHGWQQIKLYFMIGLPTETDEDLDAAIELCRKVRDAAGKGVRRLQVTGAFSTFVPKAHTPFQWEGQIPLSEIERRISYLRERFKVEKNLKMRWHEPGMSFLEGIVSRGDRRMADVVETAYYKGDIFTAWMDEFSIEPWLEALEEHGLTPEEYTGPRSMDAPLPWEHIQNGVSRDFLLNELKKAFCGATTPDCRYDACQACGSCDKGSSKTLLGRLDTAERIRNRLNFKQRDQLEYTDISDNSEVGLPTAQQPEPEQAAKASPPARRVDKNHPPEIVEKLAHKEAIYRIWYNKKGAAIYLSQLELQPVFERAFRRAALPISFSQGFHPLPLLTFGRALPVGVESNAEWCALTLSERRDVIEMQKTLAKSLPKGLKILYIEELPLQRNLPQAIMETYTLELTPESRADKPRLWPSLCQDWRDFEREASRIWTRETKKGPRTSDLRQFFSKISLDAPANRIELEFDWSEKYVSPLTLCLAVTDAADILDIKLTKKAQILDLPDKDPVYRT